MNPSERLFDTMKGICILGVLIACILIVHSLAYQDELDRELAVVEKCNAMHKPAYRDKRGVMRCATNAPSWSFVNPMKGGKP